MTTLNPIFGGITEALDRGCQSVSHPLPVLLTEIIYLIMGQLYHDAFTLKSCSLTCRLWLSSSRSQLFRAISVSEERITAFHHFLIVKPSPGIAENIRELTLVRRITPLARYPSRTLLEILDLASTLPNLRTLHSTVPVSSSVHLLRDETMVNIMGYPLLPSSATTIVIALVNFGSVSDLFRFMNFFPYLKTLELENCHLVNIESSGVEYPALRLTSLRLDAYAGTHGALLPCMIQTVLRSHVAQTLERLEFASADVDELRSLGQLLSVAGPELKHLRLGVRRLVNGDAASMKIFESLNLSLCTNLTSLHLRSIRMKYAQITRSTPGVCQILQEFLAHCLRQITLAILIYQNEDWTIGDDLGLVDWQQMAQQLGRFPALEIVSVTLDTRHLDNEDLVAALLDTIETGLVDLDVKVICGFGNCIW